MLIFNFRVFIPIRIKIFEERAKMKIQQTNLSFGTRIKISGVIRKYDAHKTVLDGALRAAEELAKNGKNDVLKIKWNSSSSQIPFDTHLPSTYLENVRPFYSVQLGGLRNLLNLIGENTGSKIFKNSETAKQWILDSYKTLTSK